MEIVRSKESMRNFIHLFRKNNYEASIGFVPTMGYLHEGHLSLIRAARRENDLIVVSIFVNPTQFGPNEDFERYPRDEQHDLELCRSEQTDICFLPSVDDMYPSGFRTSVLVSKLTDVLCGKYRPGHFDGVTTIVAKLFQIVKPTNAYFGQKDGQQAIVIKKMVSDLDFDVKIHVQPTVRESDGLALSSRNVYLSSEGRKKAGLIYKALKTAQDMAFAGEKNVSKLIDTAYRILSSDPSITIQYLECRSMNDLHAMDFLDEPAMLATAVFLENVRLIDNVILKPGG